MTAAPPRTLYVHDDLSELTDDPDAAWSYPVTEAKTRRIARLIGAQADPGEAEFYLEAFADPPYGLADRQASALLDGRGGGSSGAKAWHHRGARTRVAP